MQVVQMQANSVRSVLNTIVRCGGIGGVVVTPRHGKIITHGQTTIFVMQSLFLIHSFFF